MSADFSFGPIYAFRGFVAVRMFGHQIDVTDHRVLPPYFSERYGYDKTPRRHVGPFCIRWGRLRPTAILAESMAQDWPESPSNMQS